ncbi:MAG: carboxypeptidase regulatory-like domain-containing protein, partial [Planctomycetota bacterium]
MKRGAVVLGLLAIVGVVGFLLYSLNEDGADRSRRDADGARSSNRTEQGDTNGAGPESAQAKGGKRGALDDDPNRIDGPELVVRGIVLRLGKPAPGAKVMLRRARPADPSKRLGWLDPRRQTASPPPITETETDDEGRFTLRAPRRSQVTVTAVAEDTGPASVRLFVPLKRDPGEVKLELPEGYSLCGVVVNATGAPLEGAKLRCSNSDWYSYPLFEDAVTGKDGRFEFASLGRGSHSINVELEGFPRYRRSFGVPEATEVQLKLLPGGAMRGKVTDSEGRPVSDARLIVSFNARGDILGARAETTTGPDGSYELAQVPLAPLSFATVEHPDWGRRGSNAGQLRLPLEAVKAEEGLVWNIELATGATARGIVVDKLSGDPVPAAALTFMKMAGPNRGSSAARYGTTGADGRFELRHMLEGSYTVKVQGERHARAVKTWVQPGQKTSTDFFIDGINDPPEVRIEVERAGRVEGQVKGDAPGTWTQTNVQFMDNS